MGVRFRSQLLKVPATKADFAWGLRSLNSMDFSPGRGVETGAVSVEGRSGGFCA
jgi:hypothetical protein